MKERHVVLFHRRTFIWGKSDSTTDAVAFLFELLCSVFIPPSELVLCVLKVCDNMDNCGLLNRCDVLKEAYSNCRAFEQQTEPGDVSVATFLASDILSNPFFCSLRHYR